MKTKIIFLLSIVFSFLLFNFALAVGTTISPFRFDEMADPGQILERTIKVKNVSPNPTTYYFYIADFRASGELGEAELIVPGTMEGYSLASWVKITAEPLNLEPGQEKEIPFQIKIPDNASPGGYYGAIVAATTPPPAKGEGREKGAVITIGQQTASLVLLQIKGPVEEKAMVREFSSEKNFYSAPFLVKFKTRIQNLGNVHIKPVGFIEVRNIFGKSVARLDVNSNGANVLPRTFRIFQNEWNGDFGFGKYTATLVLTYGTPVNMGGQGNQSLFAETSFWIVPLKIVVPAVLGLIFFLILFIFFLRFYKKAAVKKALTEFGLYPIGSVKKQKTPVLALLLTSLLIVAVIFLIFFLIYYLFLK